MPIDYSNYPDNWDEIRAEILLRAGGDQDDPRVGACCEWCGVPNYAIGYRSDGSFYMAEYATSYTEAREAADYCNDCQDDRKYIVIVLTIAHLHDPNPMNTDPDNLAALCQRCHNIWDASLRKKSAQQTRRQKLLDDGQLELFPITS